MNFSQYSSLTYNCFLFVWPFLGNNKQWFLVICLFLKNGFDFLSWFANSEQNIYQDPNLLKYICRVHRCQPAEPHGIAGWSGILKQCTSFLACRTTLPISNNTMLHSKLCMSKFSAISACCRASSIETINVLTIDLKAWTPFTTSKHPTGQAIADSW